MNILELSLVVMAAILGLLTLIRFVFVPLALAHEVRHGRRRARGHVGELARMPSVSVVVPAYNEERVLVACVRSILASGYPDLEVVIVDDGSTDATPLLMMELAADQRVRAIRQANGGKGAALNTGFAATSGEFVLFVDADGVFTQDTIPEMLRAFEHARVGAVCGDDATMNLNRIQTRFLALISHVGTGMVRRALHLLGCVPVVSGNSGAFRRSALRHIAGAGGPMREDTIGEDLELTWRLHRAGWEVAYAPHARVLSESPSTLLSLWKQRTRWARGLLQSLQIHDDAVGSRRYRTFGPFLLYTIVSAVAVPILQVMAIGIFAAGLVGRVLAGGAVSVDLPGALWGWVVGWLLVSVAMLVFSILLDRQPADLRHLWTVVLWPFFSTFLGLTMVRAAWLELTQQPSEWNKLERTGVNSYALPASHGSVAVTLN
ncbi:MAG: glycosyltransferase family 2 protein [bacterium]|nr:glycosyltransferase family 2 protein [bacterium]